MDSKQNISSEDVSLPPYEQHGDPFESKLSKEADIVAGFYLLVIGKILKLFP